MKFGELHLLLITITRFNQLLLMQPTQKVVIPKFLDEYSGPIFYSFINSKFLLLNKIRGTASTFLITITSV